MYNQRNILILKMLGEETRYKIIEVLMKGETCACEIPELIGRTQSNTSMQLSKMQNAEILQSRREGKKMIYSIKDKNIKKIFNVLKKK